MGFDPTIKAMLLTRAPAGTGGGSRGSAGIGRATPEETEVVVHAGPSASSAMAMPQPADLATR
jgi:hypothetical protein